MLKNSSFSDLIFRKSHILVAFIMLFSLNSIAQQRSVLEKKKGFREIKLRANISDYAFLTLANDQDLRFNMEFVDDTQENVITEERKFENVNLKYDEVDVYSVNPGTENYQAVSYTHLTLPTSYAV